MKDAALNATYRKLYSTTHRQYALTVPFMELLFRLARGSAGTRPAGWVGQITSNSFMKREFGSKLIEEFLPTVDLLAVIDTSGAYIPGHGTPTVIIVGRNQRPSSDTVRGVLGIRGEPGRPDEPAKGLVWSAIVGHIDEPGHEDANISVENLHRSALAAHPWSLSGGGAVGLLKHVESASETLLAQKVNEIGFGAVTREDDAYTVGIETLKRQGIPGECTAPLVGGENVRDWDVRAAELALWPYNPDTLEPTASEAVNRFLWPLKAQLSSRVAYGRSQIERGLTWFEYSMFFTSRYRIPLSITFAFVATHNHFVLDRGGKVFKQSAPVIKLPAGASVEDHLRLLGVLNSSVACFWLKQNSHNKGNGGIGGGIGDEDWEPRYEFTGTTLKDFPLPDNTPVERPALLDELAQALQTQSPAEVATRETPTAAALEAARIESDRLRAIMIAQQEELDWDYYRIYGLIEDDLTFAGDVPGISHGDRASEIALARRMTAK